MNIKRLIFTIFLFSILTILTSNVIFVHSYDSSCLSETCGFEKCSTDAEKRDHGGDRQGYFFSLCTQRSDQCGGKSWQTGWYYGSRGGCADGVWQGTCANFKSAGISCPITTSCPAGASFKPGKSSVKQVCNGGGYCNLVRDTDISDSCKETACSDGIDNDKDGIHDISDSDCLDFCKSNPTDASCKQACANLGSSGGIDGFVNGICCGASSLRNPSFDLGSGSTIADWNVVRGTLEKISMIDTVFYGKYKPISGYAAKVSEGSDVRSFPFSIPSSSHTKNITLSGWAFGYSTIFVLMGDTPTRVHKTESTNTRKNNTWNYFELNFIMPTNTRYLTVRLTSSNYQVVYFDELKLFGDGIDYGMIKGTSANSQRFICSFNNNTNKYQWITSDSNPFSIKKFSLFDVISIGNAWFACNPDGVFTLPNTPSFDAVELEGYTNVVSEETTSGETTGGDVLGDGSGLPQTGGVTPPSLTSNAESLKDQDNFLSGIGIGSSEITNEQSFNEQTETGTEIIFTISPSKIRQYETTNLKITGSGVDYNHVIINKTGFEIKVSDDENWISTKHEQKSVYETIKITLPSGLQKGYHSLNITLAKCSNIDLLGSCTKEIYYIENAIEITEDSYSTSISNPYFVNQERFLCQKEGGSKTSTTKTAFGKITECCGPDRTFCQNQNNFLADARISGGPTGLLQDFVTSSSNKNSVLVYACKKASSECIYNLPIPGNFTPLSISDWSDYDALEFDIYFVGNDTLGNNRLNMMLSTAYRSPLLGVFFDEPVLKYSTDNSFELNKWHHIRIPLNDFIKSKDVKRIMFYSNTTKAINERGQTEFLTVEGQNEIINNEQVPTKYFMIYAIDRFFLSSKDTLYCASNLYDDFNVNIPEQESQTSSKIGKWISDLDNEKDACNNVASFKWTGETSGYDEIDQLNCCGDDQNATTSETFYNANGGCWNGAYVKNNTVVMVSVNE